MAAKAEALAIVIDVSPSMTDGLPNMKTPLENCILAANMIVQRKIFADTKSKKDEAALILFGTDGTSNSLNEQSGEGYEHVTVAKELGIMDLQLLRFINEHIVAGTGQADFLDALVVALDHLRNKCMGRNMEKKIVLFSNMHCGFTSDELDGIINGIKSLDINLIFVGPEVDENNELHGNGDESRNNENHQHNQKPLTQQQRQGLKCMRHILEQVDGEGISISELLPLLSFFEKRRRKQVTTFRGPIEIGSTLKINSYAYTKVSEERPSSWKKLSALAEASGSGSTMSVEMKRTYHLNDEDQSEVEQEYTAQAYRYGKTLVPMTTDDQKSLKLQTTKGCKVVGFTSKTNIERHMCSRNGCHIFVAQPDDEHAAIAFSALCHALVEKNMVAIVRYVSRAGNDPKIGFLTPHIKSLYESLIFVALPYREDVRQYFFAPLESNTSKEPSEEQLAAVDGLIDTMNLVRKEIVEDEEIEVELYKPIKTLNPVTQRQCQCIQSRALNPDESRLPEIEDHIARSIKVLPEIAVNCQASIEKIKEKFVLKRVEEKKPKNASYIFANGAANDEPDAKKPKEDDDDGEDGFSLSSLSKNRVSEVGSVDPINDFKVLTEGASPEIFIQVCNQMSSRIIRLVMDSFLDQYYSKALECLKVFKEQCVKEKTSEIFNTLLLKLKEETFGKRRNEFWMLMGTERITPISKSDDPHSKFDHDEAEKFYTNSNEETDAVVEQPVLEDAEDLIDML